MNTLKEEKRQLLSSFVYPIIWLLILWAIRIVESYTHSDWGDWGIYPLTALGLRGIIFSPLLHADFSHIFANSVPIFVLGFLLFYFFRKIAFKVILFSWLLGGCWVWLSARPAYHIGASGVVYSLTAFLFFIGIFKRHKGLMAVTLLVTFLYGSMIWGVVPNFFPRQQDISWESHLMGGIAGLILAIYYRSEGPEQKIHVWEEEDDDDEGDAFYKELPPEDHINLA
ncbi:MAG: rhomboid family intramembrane serine protease [Bacteroidota bacterium]